MAQKNANVLTESVSQEDMPLQFEQALAELESVVSSMESGGMPLEEAIASYGRGVRLAKICQDRLQVAQQQVLVLEQDLLRSIEDTGSMQEHDD